MYTFRKGNIIFESKEEIPWTLDGEFGGQHDVVEIQNKKQALQIMIEPQMLDGLMKEKTEEEGEN